MADEIREAYRLLELEPGSSLEAVKGAYRELIKIWHPDRFPNDLKLQKRGSEKTKAINEAYGKITAYLAGNYAESRAEEWAKRQRQTNKGAYRRPTPPPTNQSKTQHPPQKKTQSEWDLIAGFAVIVAFVAFVIFLIANLAL